MASNINPLHPIAGTPTTQSVRDNFAHAKTEIEALQVAAGAGGGSGGLQPLTINDQSGASYTIQASDINDVLVRMAVPQNQMGNIVIPTDANMNVPIGSSLMVSSNGIGVINITGKNGVAVRSPQSKTIDRKYGRIVVIKTGNNEWEIDGQLVNQLQYFVTPYDATLVTSLVTFDFDFIQPGQPMIWYLSPHDLSEIYTSMGFYNDPLTSGGYTGYGNGNITQFGTAEPIDLYFRAVLVEGTKPPLHIVEPDIANSQYGYFDFGPWIKYEHPVVGNYYGAANPRWQTDYTAWLIPDPAVTPPGSTLFKIRIDISELPTDTGIIGSFTWTITMPFQKHLKQFFTNGLFYNETNNGSAGFVVQADGKIMSLDYQPIADMFASNMGAIPPELGSDGAGPSREHFFVRVTTPNGLPVGCAYDGQLPLGAIVSGNNLANTWGAGQVSFNGPEGSTAMFAIEVLSDTGAQTLRVLTADTIYVGYKSIAPVAVPTPKAPTLDIDANILTPFSLDMATQFWPAAGDPTTGYDITGTLPTGLSFNSTTGLISGTVPLGETIGLTSVTITAHTATITSDPMTVNVNVTRNVTMPSWNYDANNGPYYLLGNDGALYGQPGFGNIYLDLSQYANTGGGVATYSLHAWSDALPDGLTLDPNTGIISGITVDDCSLYQSYYFMVSNSVGDSEPGYILFNIENNQPSWIDPSNIIVNGQVDVVAVNIDLKDHLANDGRVVPYWSIMEGALPAGVSFDYNSGVISGTPTEIFTNYIAVTAGNCDFSSDWKYIEFNIYA